MSITGIDIVHYLLVIKMLYTKCLKFCTPVDLKNMYEKGIFQVEEITK